MKCEECGKKTGKVWLREKTDPVNFHTLTRSLCTPCATKGGWARIDFGRGRVNEFGTSASEH